MKSPVKILLIIFAILQLFAVIYIVSPSIPKKIDTQEGAQTYTFKDLMLSFDLASGNYKIDDEKDPSGAQRTGSLTDSVSGGETNILKITDENYIKTIDNILGSLQNPFQARRTINTMKRDTKEMLAIEPSYGRDLKDIKMKLYVGENRRFFFTQTIFKDGSIDYAAVGHIGSYYYSIAVLGKSSPQDIFRFMETATVIQN